MLFKLENINLKFMHNTIFEKVNFVLNKGDKVGIIGDNGSGKTSLFNIVLNQIEYDGSVIFDNKNYGIFSQDEPSNHLDIKSKEVLASALNDYPGTILVVSHDNYFLDKFVTKKIKMIDGKFV